MGLLCCFAPAAPGGVPSPTPDAAQAPVKAQNASQLTSPLPAATSNPSAICVDQSSFSQAAPEPSASAKKDGSTVPSSAQATSSQPVNCTNGTPGVDEDAVVEEAEKDDVVRASNSVFAPGLRMLQEGALSNQKLQLCRPRELVGDIKEMTFIGNGSFAAVFKGSWQGAKIAVKFVVSESLANNSVGLRESVLSQLLSHPNVIQTYTTRCAVMDDESLQEIHANVEPYWPGRLAQTEAMKKGFVSGDGFGDPRQQQANAPVSFSKILLQLQVKPGQFIAVVIMEYADKGTLQDAIYKRQIFKESPRWNKRIAARALFRTAREIAIGMQHLHNSNVLHGDLKPGNVLLTSARVDRRGFIAKLTDFGLSHVAEGAIATNTWGTLRYMAPEHFQGTMSRATDVYAFGMLLWEMVSGRKPYEDMHQGEIIQCVSQGLRPVWPPDCFPHLEYLGKRCLAHHPDERPSFTEIVKEIEDMEVMLRDLLQQAREGSIPAADDGRESGNQDDF